MKKKLGGIHELIRENKKTKKEGGTFWRLVKKGKE